MAEQLLITAMGLDRPGILTRLTGLVSQCNGNIHDSRQAIMGDHFTLIMLLTGDRFSIARMEQAIPGLAVELDLLTTVKRIGAKEHQSHPVIAKFSTHGVDKPGLTDQIVETLASHGVNIHTLQSATQDLEQGASFQLEMALQSTEQAVDWEGLKLVLTELCKKLELEWQLEVFGN